MSIDVNVQNDLVIVTESSEDIVVNVSNAAGPQGPAGAPGQGVPVGGSTGQVLKKFTNTNYDTYWAADASGLTSVGLSMPSGFSVSNNPLTSNGTISVAGAGTTSQYLRGDGSLATFPSIPGGTVTSVNLTAGTGVSVSGGPITTSGSILVTNTAPDQVVSLTGSGTTTITGAYPNFTISSADSKLGTVTSVDMTVPTGLTISGNPITSAGTLAVALASGYSIPTTASQTTWNTAYNDSIVSAAVTGTTTKTLTLNQQDGGTVTASWSDLNTDAVTSVFGRTGSVVATEGDYNLTQLGDVTLTSPTNGQVLKYNGTTWVNNTDTDTGLTSVGLSMPSAFSVANSPLTSNGTIAVTGSGTVNQYVRGDGALATFPSTAGGGSSVNYYLNGSIASGVSGYQQMANNAVIGAGTNFNLVGNGLLAQFLTDAGNPNRVEIPGGAWNFEMYFSVSSVGGAQKFYVELYKYNGSTFTLIASNSSNPEAINGGTATDLYLTSLAVPTTSLLVTDRLALRVYIVDNSGARTVTLHTEDNNLCQIVTTFANGVASLNGLTASTQYFATGTSGSDFNINSVSDTHTFNLPTASASNRGLLSSSDWTTFNNKQNTITNPVTGTGTTNYLPKWTSGSAIGNSLVYDDGTNVGIGTATPSTRFQVVQTLSYDGIRIVSSNATTQNTLQLHHDNDKAVIETTYLGSGSFKPLCFNTQGGNVLINSVVDNGNRLQVSGTARISDLLTATGIVSSSIIYTTTGNAISAGGNSFAVSPSATRGIININGSSDQLLTFSTQSYIYNSSALFRLLSTNDFDIVVGGTQRLLISSSTGAATFSSDVTISGVLQETVTTNRQTVSYTLALTDRGKLVEMNVATANNLTVPLNSSIAFPIGTKIDLAQYGAGQTTVVATSGVTVRSAGGALKLTSQYSGATLVKIATDEWYLFGNITV